jgi:hypothetical protein
MSATESPHCDDYVEDCDSPPYVRWWIFINRLPATIKLLSNEMGVKPVLFANVATKDHSLYGKRVKCVMASRLGDIGITEDLTKEYGYSHRVMVDDLGSFGLIP